MSSTVTPKNLILDFMHSHTLTLFALLKVEAGKDVKLNKTKILFFGRYFNLLNRISFDLKQIL